MPSVVDSPPQSVQHKKYDDAYIRNLALVGVWVFLFVFVCVVCHVLCLCFYLYVSVLCEVVGR